MIISTDKTKGLGWFTRVNKDAFWRMKILRPVLVVLADGRGFRFDTHREAELAKRNGYQDILDRDDYLDELFLSWNKPTDRSYLLSPQGLGKPQVRRTEPLVLPKNFGKSQIVSEEILNSTIRLSDSSGVKLVMSKERNPQTNEQGFYYPDTAFNFDLNKQ